ncbi:hypothetical protein DOY81_003939 [Sarcophaga bullata]|nr:hypothetical protein DOY81_003939 [Sarcophaga bullata]
MQHQHNSITNGNNNSNKNNSIYKFNLTHDSSSFRMYVCIVWVV